MCGDHFCVTYAASLLTFCYHRNIQNEQVVMLGDSFAGKTSLVLRFAEGHYRDSARSATVGVSFPLHQLDS